MDIEKKNTSFLCTLSLIAGILLFSTLEISGKVVIQTGAKIEPFTMVFIRFIFSGIILLALSLPGYLKKNKLGKRDILNFAINGLVGIAFSLVFFHAGIAMFDNASSAAVVFSANALFTTVLSKFINKEELTLRKCIAVLIGLCGISLFIFEKGVPSKDTFYALLVMSFSAFLFAFSVCFTKKVVKKYTPMLFMGGSSIFGAIIILPFALYFGNGNIISEVMKALPSMSYIVFIGTTLAYYLYYTGLSGVSAFKASMAFFLKPCAACIFAWLYLGNKMNAYTITGTIILIIALCLTVKQK